MTDHVFALGTATTTPITLNDDEDVLACSADTNDECVVVTSRRVIVIADDAQLSCDFADLTQSISLVSESPSIAKIFILFLFFKLFE